MSKVYKVGDVFYDKGLKSYVKAVASDSECCDGEECALHRYDCSNVGDCSGFRFVKVAAPKCSVGFNQESAWGINPSEKPKETMGTIMAKGERIANSIMGFNSSELPPLTIKTKTLSEILKDRIALFTDLQIPSVKTAYKFIVSLLENNMLEPSVNPKIHNSIESAEKEAERLCRLHNQEFVVLKVTASFKPQQPKKEVFA